MPLRFRKSVSVAGVRLNFGKSGLTSVSSGVRGFRVTSGRNGTRVTLSIPGMGISYTEKIGSPARSLPVIQAADLLSGEQAIQTVTTADLGEISSQELIEQINKRANKFPLVIVPITFFVLFFSLSWAVSPIVLLLFTLACAAATWWAYQKDVERRTTHLHYELDSEQTQKHGAIQEAAARLAQSHVVWQTISQQSADWKHHGGASTLIRRDRTGVNKASLPKVTTNIEVPSLVSNGIKLFFLPDHMLVWQGNKGLPKNKRATDYAILHAP
jgi:Ca2+/Na+ antiporter